MIAVQIILIAVGALLADADECSCRCNKQDVCDEQKALTTKVYNNTDEIQKWNRHYNFVRDLARNWRYQLTHVVKQQLEVGINETLEDLKNACQKEECIPKEDLIARIESLENSTRAIHERADELDWTMETLSEMIERITELGPIQLSALCSPPCENGGQCVKNVCYCPPSFTGERCQQAFCSPPCENRGECMKGNVCNCTPFFNGDRCQDAACSPRCKNEGQCLRNNVCKCAPSFYGYRCEGGPKCGVDFNNGGENTRSVLVWPWMAAVYVNITSGSAYSCGGSVIHRHFVLTSAGCVNRHGRTVTSVKLGLSDLKNGTHLQEHRIQSIHIHPQFMIGSYTIRDYNIALLELEEPIPFGPFVRPVCLPPREIPQDDTMYKPQSTAKAVRLAEYLSSPQTSSPTVLDFTISPQEECRRLLKERGWEKHYPSPDLSFCTEIFTSTCPKNGSPLMESRAEGGGTRTWTQVGISNCWSIGGSDKSLFSPRLDHLRAWVDATIAASSKL